MMVASIRKFVGFLCAVMVLGACQSSSVAEIEDWMAKTDQDLKGDVEPLPKVVPYVPFLYEAQDKKDPFSERKLSLVHPSDVGRFAPDLKRVREMLEFYDLAKLKMVGSIERGGVVYALIQVPDGTVVRVKSGQYMGLNHGRILRVAPAQVDLQEIVEDTNGDWVKRNASLSLSEG